MQSIDKLGNRLALCILALATSLETAPVSAQVVTFTNQLANHWARIAPDLPDKCPNGVKINIPAGYRIERPSTVYNSATREWVMWAHYESSAPGSGYTLAQAFVANSTTGPCGPFNFVQGFRPLNQEVRDAYVYKDPDTGEAWYIAASRNNNGGANNTLAVFKLTSNYLSVDESAGVTWVDQGLYRESPTVVKVGGIHYMITSKAAGWFPSQAMYQTATSMQGPWSALAPLTDNAGFGGQTVGVSEYKGTQTTSYTLELNHLSGTGMDGHMALPLTFNPINRTAKANWYTTFKLDVATGRMILPALTDLAMTGTATAHSSGATTPPGLASDGDYATRWVAANSSWPGWWQVDLKSRQDIGEVQISWYQVAGSEGYYSYMLDYSDDGVTWNTLDRSANTFYGFTVDRLNVYARYLRVRMLKAKLRNNPNNWYTPQLYEVRILPATWNSGAIDLGFEKPIIGAYQYNPVGGEWTFSGIPGDGAGIAANGSDLTAGNPAAPEGTQVAFLQRSGAIERQVTGLEPGKTYRITLKAAQRANTNGGQLGQTFNVTIDGAVRASFSPAQWATTYRSYSTTFVANAPVVSLGIKGTNLRGGDNTIFVDAIAIDQID